MAKKQQIKIDNTTTVRDVHSKAVLETNYSEYTAHLRRRARDKEVKEMKDKMTKILEILEKSGIDVNSL